MDVRESVYQLVERVAAGATCDEAAEGLDLGWDHHGNHASDFLCMPGLWQRLDERRLFEVVDWFLRHGADRAHLLERTLTDGAYAGEGENPIRGYLLSRAPPPDLGRALVGAFCRRRLALARSLLARGADAGLLRDWVEADLVTPATIDVAYQPSDEEQLVTLTMLLRPLQPGYAGRIPECAFVPRALVRLGARGLLGGELFDPRSSRVTEASIESETSKVGASVRLALRVRGVAPAGLALVFRSFVGRNLHWYPGAIALKGEVAPIGDASSVDSARARSWFRDVSTDAYTPPCALPFPVTAKPRKGMFAVVEHREGAWRDIHGLGQDLDPELLAASTVGFDADQPQSPFAHFDSRGPSTTKTEILMKRYGRGSALDPAPLRAAFLHGLAAIEGVTSVRWCDDAGATRSTEDAGNASPPKPSTKKPAAKAKRAKAVAVAHPDRGPSRIAELRTRVGSGELPWRSEGVASGVIPTALGDAPLPATLRAWLEAGDATWPLSKVRPFEPRTFGELLAEVHPDLADVFAPLGQHLLAGGCVPLFVPSSCKDGTLLFLHAPLADSTGEPPVIGFDLTDEGLVGVFASRFDHYLARVLGVDRTASTFAPGPLVDPYLKALVGRLPARQRPLARPHQGVIAIGSLLFDPANGDQEAS